MKQVRQLHLYLGTLFAPLIIFFAFSGALQTLGLHESERGSGSTPAWIAQIASIHKNQRLQGANAGRRPPNRPQNDAAPNAGAPNAGAPNAGAPNAGAPNAQGQPAGENRPEGGPPAQSGPSPWPLKWFVVLMSLGLIVTTALGIYMAFKYGRNKAVVWGLLALGTVLPIALLFL